MATWLSETEFLGFIDETNSSEKIPLHQQSQTQNMLELRWVVNSAKVSLSHAVIASCIGTLTGFLNI